MTKNQIEYNLGMSQLQARYAELQNEQQKLRLERQKFTQQQALDYGYIFDDQGNFRGINPTGGYKSRQAEADIAATYAAVNEALANEKYGGGVLGDLRRGLESMFPFLKTYWTEENSETGGYK